MKLKFTPIPTERYEQLINGGLDAHERMPIKQISDGGGMPCRHCLADIARGDEFFTLAYSPFETQHAYAEVGPIFLHANACEAFKAAGMPPSFLQREYYMMRGYSKTTKAIIYGTGQRVATADIEVAVAKILQDDDCDYVHLRSASYTCFACKIVRG
ncbi:MAG: DUF1203 domain-containing protein [Rhizobiales bacterium]|nr:DUF1203 domain-containing protein [Hyphomicrobiales bacterium]NRB14644.1 DUF1203 domain-containing protein [Hyphomicrobiales bacterium]